MSIMIYPDKFDDCNLHYEPAVQNNDADDSKFSRIVYSTKHISLNGICIALDFVGVRCEQHYNKMFVSFDPGLTDNHCIVSQLHLIEHKIINKYVDSVLEGTRQCIYSLTDQLNRGSIKIYAKDNDHDNDHDHDKEKEKDIMSHKQNMMIQIYGVWETNDECGITYKFVKW